MDDLSVITELRLENERLRALLQLAKNLRVNTDQFDILQAVLDCLATMKISDSCFIALLKADGNVSPVAARGIELGECGDVLTVSSDAWRTKNLSVSNGWIFQPLVFSGDLLGLIAARGVPEIEGQDLETVFQDLAELVACYLADVQNLEREASRSATDGVTGLFNHRYFHQLLAAAIGQSYLTDSPVSLIICDIDHFKNVNDTFGHPFGDFVLREMGRVLKSAVRGSDICARYGGEEFAIILPGTSADVAVKVADRIRTEIANHDFFEHQTGLRAQLTASFGVSTYVYGTAKERLVQCADEALYQSKHEGRNRVSFKEMTEE